MSRVRTGLSISLDGFIGGLGELGWPVHERLHGWKFGLASFYEAIGEDGGEDNADSRLLAEQNAHIGAFVMGKGMFDAGEEPWGDTPPFGAPVFILTHTVGKLSSRRAGRATPSSQTVSRVR